MEAQLMGEVLYAGADGYVEVRRLEHNSSTGAILRYKNPEPRKLHAVDFTGMRELEDGIDIITRADGLDFCVLIGAYDPIHAGADITQFAGEPDYAAIQEHLERGTKLDIHIKNVLWKKLRTVGVFAGDRYGGSVEWPLFAEWNVAAVNSRIQFSEVHLGIVPGWNGILNVLLRSNPLNALYMGTTGDPVTAEQMRMMGIVQRVIDTPEDPNRREVAPEEWPQVWAMHAKKCQTMLLYAALELATQDEQPKRERDYAVITEDKLEAAIKERTDVQRYIRLQDEIAAEYAKLGDAPGKDELKQLAKAAGKGVSKLGKPLAPQAVDGIRRYVAKWGALETGQLLEQFGEAALEKAQLCVDLMHTAHRRIGVNAVLSKLPAERVPVFGE